MTTPRHQLIYNTPRRGNSIGVWPPQRQVADRVGLIRQHHIWSGPVVGGYQYQMVKENQDDEPA